MGIPRFPSIRSCAHRRLYRLARLGDDRIHADGRERHREVTTSIATVSARRFCDYESTVEMSFIG